MTKGCTVWYPCSVMNWQDHIGIDPKILVGKPVVKGTRIQVERVIRHLAENPNLDDLFQAFPHLTINDVKACLAYAHATLERSHPRPARPRSASKAPQRRTAAV